MGIMNYCSHDPACCVVRLEGNKLELISAEEGFLSRKKKSYHFPIRSMKYCLDYFDISIDNIDVLMLDFMDEERTIKNSNNYRLLIAILPYEDKKEKLTKSTLCTRTDGIWPRHSKKQ